MKVKRKMTVDTEKFELGDIISFKLTTGEKVQARAVKETPDGMLFVTVDCLKDEYPMFKNPDDMGSVEICYLNSDLRYTLNNEILVTFPEEIRSRMVDMRIGNGTEFNLLRIPSEKEIFGENKYGQEKGMVEQFKGMKNRRNRIAWQGSKTGEYEYYWLMNRHKEYASDFANVNDNGDAYYSTASNSLGVRPVFLLS